MSFTDIPFAKVRALLLGLGFVERVVDGKYLGFYHAASDALFAFRMYRPQDMVSSVDLRDVRKDLDWRGLLSEEAFDAALRKVSA
jgi:hypothetical protein